jgi:uncharacterized membrane protein YdjX (TVP38/TMEM64 family)
MLEWLTEDHLKYGLEQFRSLGPVPGIVVTFMKSFVPPLPTIVIVGVNAAVYGLWLGFLYSWLGLVTGCLTTFALVRKLSGHPLVERWAEKPKVKRGLQWVRRNAFGYVFILSLFPVGPFVVVNIAAAIARMRFASFAIAVAFGKAVMVFVVSYVGHDVQQYVREPIRLVYVVLLVAVSLYASKKLEARFSKPLAEKGSGRPYDMS